jgi:hypothetical protein
LGAFALPGRRALRIFTPQNPIFALVLAYKLKYRYLTDAELAPLEAELKQFLIANGVHAEEWRALNAQTPENARELVGIFSDLVFDKILETAEYLVHRSAADVKVFQCGAEGMVLLGLKVNGSAIDLTQEPYKSDLGSALVKAGPEQFRLFRAEKKYAPERKAELFQMMEQGCEISDGSLFGKLKQLYQG